MTLRVTIAVPKDSGNYTAVVKQTNGNPDHTLAPGTSLDVWIHSGNQITVAEASPAAAEDFPLGKPCDLSDEKTCDSCQ